MTDTSNDFAAPMVAIAAAVAINVAQTAMENYDTTKSPYAQAVQLPNPLLYPLRKIPVVIPLLVEVGGVAARMAMITFSDATDDFAVDATVPPKPLVMMAMLPTETAGLFGIGVTPYEPHEGEEYTLDPLEQMFLNEVLRLHEAALSLGGSVTLDEEFVASATAGLDADEVRLAEAA